MYSVQMLLVNTLCYLSSKGIFENKTVSKIEFQVTKLALIIGFTVTQLLFVGCWHTSKQGIHTRFTMSTTVCTTFEVVYEIPQVCYKLYGFVRGCLTVAKWWKLAFLASLTWTVYQSVD